ncbi:MAG: EscU/YscU/HrcU family type III secretion system export apparatus switch protein [Oscillospiraceae bacterium]|nr:EscU/YscU/HrcU family type III secretion system export apparatus switch protein [Oscillospiraceae bacterium]
MSDEKAVRKPVREAVALAYEEEAGAPSVVASGRGQVAENIIGKAREAGVPVHADPHLAHALNMLQIGQEIPAELYNVVAQVLIYVRDIDERREKRKSLTDS